MIFYYIELFISRLILPLLSLAFLSGSPTETLPDAGGVATEYQSVSAESPLSLDFLKSSSCVPSAKADKDELLDLARSSCARVADAANNYKGMARSQGSSVAKSWSEHTKAALTKCEKATNFTGGEDPSYDSALEGATLAVDAWSNDLMQGRECCNLPYPPFCQTSSVSSRLGHAVPFIFGILMVFGALLGPRCCRSCSRPRIMRRAVARPLPRAGQAVSLSAAKEGASTPATWRGGPFSLRHSLYRGDFGNTSLSALSNWQPWFDIFVETFDNLQKVFGFQPASVENQYEHFISLLRSTVSACIDGGRVSLREEDLIHMGILKLHDRFLEDFLARQERWNAATLVLPDKTMTWLPHREPNVAPTCPNRPEVFRKLGEICAYLCVWGEAGNLRFMPESIYYLLDLVLKADARDSTTGALKPVFEQQPLSSSWPFLAFVVRPIYNVIFDENYLKVSIRPDKKDDAALKPECKAFQPPDCINYDDWNELFFDAERCMSAIVMMDENQSKISDLPAGQQLNHLQCVDWARSLSHCKTHRELHSWVGVFAAIHRVVFVHTLGFTLTLAAVSSSPSLPGNGDIAFIGNDAKVRFATAGLLVPFHALLWTLASWGTAGEVVRRRWCGWVNLLTVLPRMLIWCLPIVTYALVREAESEDMQKGLTGLSQETLLTIHLVLCGLGACAILFAPAIFERVPFKPTGVPVALRSLRFLFWALVLGLKGYVGYLGIVSLNTAMNELQLSRVALEPPKAIADFAFSPEYDKDTLQWCIFMMVGLLVYIADTQFWFSLGCSVLGLLVGCSHKGWKLSALICEDDVANIPKRFAVKALGIRDREEGKRKFLLLWSKVVQHMRYEDLVWGRNVANLTAASAGNWSWEDFQSPINTRDHPRLPQFFEEVSACDRCISGAARSETHTTDAVHRCALLGRDLSNETMPVPCRIPFVPGLTVLIPHFAESIILRWEEDLMKQSHGDTIPLMDWLEYRYRDQFSIFLERHPMSRSFSNRGTEWQSYRREEKGKIAIWASMVSQTLFRTVAGIELFDRALEFLRQVSAEEVARSPFRAFAERWQVEEAFTCLVAMQLYAYDSTFDKENLRQTNMMLEKFWISLKIAYIDFEDRDQDEEGAKLDGIHPKQARRYYSCRIDKHCRLRPDGRRDPTFRIEMPGYPILGNGKGDNQNHAIIFSRGEIIQAIDANQGAYLEQALLLPCVLAEFRDVPGKNDGHKKIVGFPEHITSDFGSVGDFAAGSEYVFGTNSQRSYSVLGGRMHYGHPDMMHKGCMMMQGGISKATRSLHLSEDIFAGKDFTLRGNGRTIKHSEYFHLAKGRDMGFNSVMAFFSKLSTGTAEQSTSRQNLRLGKMLWLPELMTFYYAHVGYYLTQHILSCCVPVLTFLWLLVVLDAPEAGYSSMDPRSQYMSQSSASVMASLLVGQYGYLFVLFLVASAAPLVLETWLQAGFLPAIGRLTKQLLSLSPLHFIFQSKVIGHYISNGVVHGGAKYVSTGRGLPTERKFFIGIKGNQYGLYNDWATIASYDGARLLVGFVLVCLAGGLSVDSKMRSALAFWFLAVALTLLSWLFAPFIFNPHQFNCKFFKEDVKNWRKFFREEGGGSKSQWEVWYTKEQLKPGEGIRSTPAAVIAWAVSVLAFYNIIESKIHALTIVLPDKGEILRKYVLGIFPPVVFAGIYCIFVPVILDCTNRNRTSLLVDSAMVLLCDSIESFIGLWEILALGWWKSALAGIILKYALLSSLLVLMEFSLRLKTKVITADSLRCLVIMRDGLGRWLQAHRMARDVGVSAFIFAFLSVFTLGDYVRRHVFRSSHSLHCWIVYRDWGHPIRIWTAEAEEEEPASQPVEGLSLSHAPSSFSQRQSLLAASVPVEARQLPDRSQSAAPGYPGYQQQQHGGSGGGSHASTPHTTPGYGTTPSTSSSAAAAASASASAGPRGGMYQPSASTQQQSSSLGSAATPSAAAPPQTGPPPVQAPSPSGYQEDFGDTAAALRAYASRAGRPSVNGASAGTGAPHTAAPPPDFDEDFGDTAGVVAARLAAMSQNRSSGGRE